ncbi:peptidase S16 [Pseudomethylobacillus aquaticus]|uniref:Peptidase S16 n=1 Tax=Pseudomethylobacillus aquaticus TaxID=2676064 RepID=A0A3N0V6R8_9PROT|nr:LON peptidase substrate-binding domain-containing protein [Pseudomethylobacillus aquaticus]ROH88312.1 peptidase S16 [Pseudomethylobacillus aquaticus]
MPLIELPLFPLQMVMFPGGMLPLRIFEPRYLDMVRRCLRNDSQFGMVAALPEAECPTALPFAAIGTSFSITAAEVPQPSLMTIRCLATQRFRVVSARQQADGLWLGQVELLIEQASLPIPEDLQITVQYLQQLIASLKEQGVDITQMPFCSPYQFDDCAWVANRWTELLNMPLINKQRLLELDSHLLRLELICDMLDHNKPF